MLILNSFPIAWPAALVMACTLPRKGDHDRKTLTHISSDHGALPLKDLAAWRSG